MFSYYENIIHKINNDQLAHIIYDKFAKDSTKKVRPIYFKLLFKDGRTNNIYSDGKAKASRIKAIFNALENKNYKLEENNNDKRYK